MRLYFAISRVFNAAVLLTLNFVGALHLGAEEWGRIVIPQTLISYMVLTSLGVNEGFGVRVFFGNLKFRVAFKANLIFIAMIFALQASAILLTIVFLEIDQMYLVLPLGAASICLLSQLKIYLRNVNQLKRLANLYVINSIISVVFCLCYFLYSSLFSSSSFKFLIALIGAQYATYAIVGRSELIDAWNYKILPSRYIKIFTSYIYRGFPILLTGVIFEAMITTERFYIGGPGSESLLALTSLSMILIKGIIMLLSIVNTIYYQRTAKLVMSKDAQSVYSIFKNQFASGIVLSTFFVVLFYLILRSSIFSDNFPEYVEVKNIFLFQSILLIPLSMYFPLAVISNLMYGGKNILGMMIIVLFFYKIFLISTGDIVEVSDLALVYAACSLVFFLCLLYLSNLCLKNPQ